MEAPLELTDFSGGETDTPLSAPLNQSESLQNLLINKNKKPYSRPGSTFQDEDVPRFTTSSERISHLDYFQSILLGYHARKVTYSDGGVRTDLVGPSGYDVYGEGSSSTIPDSAEWRGHLVCVNDAFSKPQKIFVGMGLIEAIDCANSLKAKFNSHRASTGAHTAGADSTNIVSSDDASDLPTLVTLTTELLTDYAAHENDTDAVSGWLYHEGQETTDHGLSSTTAPTSLAECITRLTDLKSKYNAHDADAGAHGTTSAFQVTATTPTESLRVRTAGLPAPATEPTITQSSGAETRSWAFVYFRRYSIGDVIFEDFSALTTVLKTNASDPDLNTASFSNIPVLTNGTKDNYETDRIRVLIYRTTNGGTTFYKVGEIANGTTTFDDDMPDSTLEEQERIYNDGDLPENDPPPAAKTVGITNNIAVYGHVKEDGVVYPNRIRQAVPNDVDSCPADFFEDLDSSVVCVVAFDGRHFVLCEKKIYRVDGYFDEAGGGGLVATVIAENVGCVALHSVTVTEEGFGFASDDGFYFCDGNRCQKISELKKDSYRDLIADSTRKARIYGAYEQEGRRIWWAAQEGAGSDNDCAWVWDLNQGISPQSSFQTMRGQDEIFQPSALLFLPNLDMIRGDSRGYVFAHRAGLLNDPTVDTLANPEDWGESVVEYVWKSAAINFGTTAIRKWVPEITVFCDAVTSLTMDAFSYNDRTQTRAQLKEIRYRGTVLWGDAEIPWGASTLFWNFISIIKAKRKMPAMGLRCTWKQIELRNAHTEIFRSDDYVAATPDTSTNEIEIDSGAWPEDIVGHSIAFEDDDYEATYEITGRTDTTLSVADPNNTLPSGSQKWHIIGLRKNEGVLLDTVAIAYKLLSNSHNAYRGEGNVNS